MSTNSEVDAEAGTKKRNIILPSAFAVIAVIVVVLAFLSGGKGEQGQSGQSSGRGAAISVDGGNAGEMSGEIQGDTEPEPAPTYSYRQPNLDDFKENDDVVEWQSALKRVDVYTEDDSWVEKGVDGVEKLSDAEGKAIQDATANCVVEWAKSSSWESLEERTSRLGCFTNPSEMAKTWSMDVLPISTSKTSDARVWQDAQTASVEIYSYSPDLDGHPTALVEVMVDRAQFRPDSENPDKVANRRSGTYQVLARAVNDGGTWKVAAIWIPTS